MECNIKILIVSASDIVGGANKAAYRLHRSLLNRGVNSQMLVQNKFSDDYTVIGPKSNFRKYLLNPVRPALDHIFMKIKKADSLFSTSYLPFSDIISTINDIKPDIVHLHWIAGGMIRIEEIAKIAPPIIWSLHDMWAFTGGCHYDKHCGLYKDACGKCKILEKSVENDLSRKTYKRKLRSYSKIKKMEIVATSKWIARCAKESTLLTGRVFTNLPNPIDTDVFKKIDKNLVRDIFNIPQNKKVVLFGAMSPISDSRKGSKELFEAINMLKLKNIVIVIAGSSETKKSLNLKHPVYFIPPMRDESSLPLIYNIADVMIVPSIQENLANSIIESLSCETPVVAFNVGGNGDMIVHKKNGYLAKAINPKDLSIGIDWVLRNNDLLELSNYSRRKVMSEFDSGLVSKKYIDLYEKVLEK